ncbi:leucine-rich repeat and WD repeat-containing protein 1 [Nilaparvata lugens]|uniref:leucine-rich repeat and WD repeat-containing protein 1 n=1 Tax=Nilaparvata lugens TaxID=108931 RepID=UPI00193E9450|nr:leucine-rich repeat and WD repeat-containing protein 1 [Nilaparvata lugens]
MTSIDHNFEPAYFLRCHSKKNDNADVQTQVWMCQFEPDPENPEKTTNIVATCGGNSVCLIDVTTGKVVAKYIPKDLREMLYTLCWASWPLPGRGGTVNVIATAGVRNTVHLILPAPPTLASCFLTHHFDTPRRIKPIQALIFLPHDPYTVIVGDTNGVVRVCKITVSGSPPFEDACSMEVLYELSTESEIFSFAFCTTTQILLAGCNDGLMGFEITDENHSPKLLKFSMPILPDVESALVDSVEIIGNGLVASKCALHPAIYIWHLPTALKCNCTVAPTHLLHWSDTDNYFMYIGLQSHCGLLCCGDDMGALWLYDILNLDTSHRQLKPIAVEPSAIFPWPILSDSSTEKKRKLNLDVYDIVVDKVTINYDGTCIVAVTNNNLVCIWKRKS